MLEDLFRFSPVMHMLIITSSIFNSICFVHVLPLAVFGRASSKQILMVSNDPGRILICHFAFNRCHRSQVLYFVRTPKNISIFV